ncbi:MAG: 2-amino-4-hydroxy-6-hydroxymethyldihydropteridine diphosphokinase [Chloroflexota bacterium]|nr:2-amino-4-hydroxy-6-hydroxymethyldihydropteridine diphosphokinase [Chloroflexota bacterium]
MATPVHTVYLGLGANLGDRAATLGAARQRLAPDVQVLAWSSLYETAPWGVSEQPPFLNAVCQAQTALSPTALLAYLKARERELGRVPSFRWGPRAIDIDILLYDELVLNAEQLTLPHPRLHERAFVLVPLLELAPDLRHPVIGRTVRELVADLPPDELASTRKDW